MPISVSQDPNNEYYSEGQRIGEDSKTHAP